MKETMKLLWRNLCLQCYVTKHITPRDTLLSLIARTCNLLIYQTGICNFMHMLKI